MCSLNTPLTHKGRLLLQPHGIEADIDLQCGRESARAIDVDDWNHHRCTPMVTGQSGFERERRQAGGGEKRGNVERSGELARDGRWIHNQKSGAAEVWKIHSPSAARFESGGRDEAPCTGTILRLRWRLFSSARRR